MKLSELWLREWVDPAISTDELVAQLTMAGLEVDSVEAVANDFSGVAVAEVISAEKHPDADKLSLCQVTDGSETYQVVCGAPNVRAGLKIPYARIGAVLASDFKIKKARLRGIESFGMLCSAAELGLAEEADGLLELPADAPVGEDIRVYLNLEDKLIDVDLTPNRGDCLSVAGLAREVGVLNNLDVKSPQIESVPATISDTFPVTLDAPDDCPRYLGRIIRNINTGAQSPLWLQEKLRRADIRSIDPIVDVTNYVLLELGQPMHAFDFDKLQGGIHVRRANAKEKLILLDDREVELNPEILVIADEANALAMAGVMGGLASSVTDATQNIFLESAFFNPVTIAGKARTFGMHTDAAHRYERGVDYALANKAMERATALLLEIVGGEPGPVVEALADLPEIPPVTLRKSRIKTLLGLEIADTEVETILARLGLVLLSRQGEQDAVSWTFSVPSWRFDISIEADLIEELARIYGYDNLPVTEQESRLALKPFSEAKVRLQEIRRKLTALGYQEVITYSFVEPGLETMLGINAAAPVKLANPISQDMSVMRSSLWPGLIKTLKHNQNRQHNRVRIFESGLVFINKNKELEQIPKVASLLWGSQLPEQWGSPETAIDFFDIKGDVETLLGLSLDLTAFSFKAEEHPALQYGQSARIYRGDKALGWVGALHPNHMQALDITGKVYVFELDLTVLEPASLPAYTELSRFPSVRRDLAMIVEQGLEIAAVEALIREKAGEYLSDIVFFDVYQGENIEKGKKSLALGLTFQHPSRTLTDDEINVIIDSCINAIEAQFNAELRK